MQVIIESRSIEGSALRSVAEKRVRFVMRRLAWQIPIARVSLSDLNGPKGGEDKQVQVALKLAGASLIVVTATSRDWRAAIDAALSRAVQKVVRTMRRARQATTAALPPPQFEAA
jgi:ribosome-associated translation inhibitor RaiA